ncbi:MAG: histidine kinase [Treponemataceae bacterium]|nr:histidine kinase [Treponemataceae bacterium]
MDNRTAKFFLSIILSLFFWNLSATELFFQCKYSEIPSDAKGTYSCDAKGNLRYTSPDGDYIELLVTPDFLDSENYKINRNFVPRNIYDLYGKKFWDFDEKGNFYFLSTLTYLIFDKPDSYVDYETVRDQLVLYKFNPVTLSVTYKVLNPGTTVFDFCVSKDGKHVFVDCLEEFSEDGKKGLHEILAIPADSSSNPEKLFPSKALLTSSEKNVSSICFDGNTNTFYFSLSGTGGNSDSCNVFGAKPEFNGNYTTENLFNVNSQFVSSCRLYANNEGLWGVSQCADDDKCSSLVLITDPKGDTVKKQPDALSQVQIFGNWFYNPRIIAEKDFLLFITPDKSDVMQFSEGRIRNVSNYLPEKMNFEKDDLSNISKIIQWEIEEEKGKGLISIGFLSVFICIIGVLVLIVVILLLWIGHLSNKSNQLKKDKKFIFGIQEAERGKISRDIHDSIIQDIRSIRLKTELLKTDEETEATKNDVIRLATDCVIKLRNICYNLTPAELTTHEDGNNAQIELVSIIQSIVLQFIERTHVPCKVKIDENFTYPVLDKETSQNLFRIIQEALTNIEKHSYATDCQIWIRNSNMEEKTGMAVFISDDGIGCDLKSVRKNRSKIHFGLQNIIERAKLIGATVDFQSEPGHGFEISIRIQTDKN